MGCLQFLNVVHSHVQKGLAIRSRVGLLGLLLIAEVSICEVHLGGLVE